MNMINMMKQPLFSASFFVFLSLFSCFTALAQSPTQAPQSPPTPTLPQSPADAMPPVLVPTLPQPPATAPTPADAPAAPSIDIIKILLKAKRFSILIRLLKTTQLVNQLNSELMTANSGGLTLFAPEDSAFSRLKVGFLNSLNDQQKVELLQFHVISPFVTISNFDTLTNPVRTQAGDNPGRLQLNVTSYGGQVNMTTGIVNASVTGTVYSDNKLAIYQVDKVLLPLDFFAPKARAPAPAALASATGAAEAPNKKKSPSDDSNVNDDSTTPVDVSDEKSTSSSIEGGMWVSLLALGVGFIGAATM